MDPFVADIMAEYESRFAMRRYRKDIVAYARDKHGVWLWKRQREVCEALVTPPHRVMVESANGIGKTLLMGLDVAWFHDCFDPGIGIATAPNFEQIKRTTFAEARGFLKGRPGLKPQNPTIYHHEKHYFDGFTAIGATGFQGVHGPYLMILIEEATGVPRPIWVAARGIAAGGVVYRLSALNPTDPSCAAKAESESGTWKVIRISAFEHPNVLAELTGRVAPIPGAVTLGWSPDGNHTALLDNMKSWGDRDQAWHDTRSSDIDVDLHDPSTFGFDIDLTPIEVSPAGDTVTADEVIAGAKAKFPARFWRPGPDGEARICGRYPAQAAYAIFSQASLDRAYGLVGDPVWTEGVRMGCDVARFGDDSTTIWVMVGDLVVRQETRNKQDTSETAGLIKSMCDEYGRLAHVEPWTIPVNVDDTGVGGGVVDQARHSFRDQWGNERDVRYNFIPVNAQQAAAMPETYPNARSEMLFQLADLVREGKVRLGRLGSTREKLTRQATQVRYRLDNKGRRVAERKEDVKKRVGGSPDELDGLALCTYRPASDTLGKAAPPAEADVARLRAKLEPSSSRDKYFGSRSS